MTLPLDIPPQRRRWLESERLYQAILRLRRCGRSVYQQGADHVVDGTICSDHQLLELANSVQPGDQQ